MAIPPAICVTDATSWKVRPVELDRQHGHRGQPRDAERRERDRVVGLPRPRRVPGAARERPRRVDVARGSPRAARRRSAPSPRRTRPRPASAPAAAPARSRSTAAPRAGRTAPLYGAPASTQLDHHRQRALHVARAQPMHARRRHGGPGRLSCAGTVSRWPASSTGGRIPAGRASTHESPRSPPRRRRRAARRRRARRAPPPTRDSDGMSISSSVRARRSASSVSLGAGDGHRRTLEWKALERSRNGRTSESRYAAPPEAGRAKQRAILHRRHARMTTDLAELKELLRTAGVAVVGELVQKRDSPHPNTLPRPGQGRGAQAADQGVRRERRRRRRRADAAPAAQPRGASSACRCSTAPR